jgi:hypothetical protein
MAPALGRTVGVLLVVAGRSTMLQVNMCALQLCYNFIKIIHFSLKFLLVGREFHILRYKITRSLLYLILFNHCSSNNVLNSLRISHATSRWNSYCGTVMYMKFTFHDSLSNIPDFDLYILHCVCVISVDFLFQVSQEIQVAHIQIQEV